MRLKPPSSKTGGEKSPPFFYGLIEHRGKESMNFGNRVSCSNCRRPGYTLKNLSPFEQENYLCELCQKHTLVCDVCLRRFVAPGLKSSYGIFCSEKCQDINYQKIADSLARMWGERIQQERAKVRCAYCNGEMPYPGPHTHSIIAYDKFYCGVGCSEKHRRTMPQQLPLPFPPSALNTPKETLKVRVNQNTGLTAVLTEWYQWLTNKDQLMYNRVEFKFKGVYVVFAKLKPESEKE